MVWDARTKYRQLLKLNNVILEEDSRDGLFKALASEIRSFLRYDRFSINLYDQERRSLSYFATADGVSPEGMDESGRPLLKGAIAQQVINTGQPVIVRDLKAMSDHESVQRLLAAGLTSTMAFPMKVRQTVLGSLHFTFRNAPQDFAELAAFLDELSGQVAIAVDNMLAQTELKRINDQLEKQNRYLISQMQDRHEQHNFFYESKAMREVMRQVRLIADTDAPVLITGETGTGKDYVARLIHELSPRNDALYVKVNCPALAATLFESELFGHTKGAFTGASTARAGRFELANGGTVCLDEIGDLPMAQQAKLLHVLQDGVFERVGESKPIAVNFRVIAATNKDLAAAIRDDIFRSDLFYRLNTVSLHLPPLRERVDDIELLIARLTDMESDKLRLPGPIYTRQAMGLLRRYSWPGNVRELKNLVKRMIILHPGKEVFESEIDQILHGLAGDGRKECLTLAEVEKGHIEKVLARTAGVVAGPTGAAALLGLPRTTLQYRMRKYGLEPVAFTGRDARRTPGRTR